MKVADTWYIEFIEIYSFHKVLLKNNISPAEAIYYKFSLVNLFGKQKHKIMITNAHNVGY